MRSIKSRKPVAYRAVPKRHTVLCDATFAASIQLERSKLCVCPRRR